MKRSDVTRRGFLGATLPLLQTAQGTAATAEQAPAAGRSGAGGAGAVFATFADLQQNRDSSIRRAIVEGYYFPGDGGGGTYYATAASRAGTSPGATTWHLAATGAPLSAKAFGTRGDGKADDTDALKRWLAALQAERRRGLLPFGRYRVREGELKWMVGTEHEPGPWIETDPGATLVAAQVNDAPLFEIANTTPFRFAIGGFIGPIWFEDRPQAGVSGRHGLQLSGVQNIHFGFIRSTDLSGDTIRCVARELNGNPDPHHVALCHFDGIESIRGKGWTVNNDNGVGLNGCEIAALRNLLGGAGAFRGAGAGNRIKSVSVGSCVGWAIDLNRDRGTVERIVIDSCELDAPEFGIRMAGISLGELTRIRFVHRAVKKGTATLYHPRVALSMGHAEAAARLNAVRQMRVDVTHRIEGNGPREALGVLFTANDDANVTDVEVRHALDSAAALVPDTLAEHIAGASAVRVFNREVVVHDSYPRPHALAWTSAGAIRNHGFRTADSKVAWNTEIFGGPSFPIQHLKPLAPRESEYVVPVAGFYRVRAQIGLAGLRAGARVQMAVMYARAADAVAAAPRLAAETTAYAAGRDVQTYAVECEWRFAKGDRIWISAAQNTEADIPITAASGRAASAFSVTPLDL